LERGLPLAYFHGITPGRYLAAWPVFVVADDPRALAVSVTVDDARHLGLQPVGSPGRCGGMRRPPAARSEADSGEP
jgi:hypothetical protein